MDWWNSFTDWAGSSQGWRVLSGAIIPFVAIVVAGVVAALIGRGATKRVITLQERESKNAAVGGIISAARKAATWGTLGHDERAYADHLAEDADIRLRLLPIPGAAVAASWAQHEIADIKRNSSTFSFQAEQSLAEFRDRMLEWQARPSRSRKLFRADLEQWKFESPNPDSDLIQRQQQWNADQVSSRSAAQAQSGGPTPVADAAPVAETSAPASPRTETPSGEFAASAPASAPVQAQAPAQADREVTPPAPSTQRPAPATAVMAPAGAMSASEHVRAASSSTIAPAVESGQHEDASSELTAPKVDATSGPGTNTTSIPTRIADAPVEPADPDETKESPYASPLSASELRRRAEDEDD